MIEKYDNRRIIVQRNVKILFDIPNVRYESASSIRSILDGVQTNTRALASLGEKVDGWDTLLIHLIVSKLDRITHKESEKTLKDANMPNLKQFLNFLKEKCQILESTYKENTNHYSNEVTQSHPSHPQKRQN